MYTLLIVDDEPELANSLCEMFQRLKQPELMVYKSYSAREALDLMHRTKIDIVMTDIKMPGMTGLNLLEHIKEKWPQCRVIFLTGYREFDYVYSAIQNQDIRYLLKTESDDKIINIVQETIDDLEKSLLDVNIMARARQQMDMALPLLQKQYFQDIIEGIYNKDELSQEKHDELKIPLNVNEELLLLVARFDNMAPNLISSKRNGLLYSLKSISDQYFTYSKNIINFDMEQAYSVWLIQPFTGNEKELDASWVSFVSLLKGHLEYIQDSCRVSIGITVSFALDSQPVSLGEIPDRFLYLKQLMANSTVLGKEMILTDKSFTNSVQDKFINGENNSLRELSRKLNRLKLLGTCLEAGHKTEFKRLLFEIIDSLRNASSKSSSFALEIYYSTALLFLNYINKWNLTEKIAFKVGLYKLTKVDEFNNWGEAVDYLYNLTDVIFEIQFQVEEKKVKDSVNAIQAYIYSNLAGDLSLVRLADVVNLNSSYLSRLFKEVAGKNLSDYINDIRINKAKELLCKSSKKISEVSCEVGYESPHSFARFFRNAVGISPQDYRESFSKTLKKGKEMLPGKKMHIESDDITE